MNEASNGNLNKVMTELEDYLNKNEQLPISALSNFLIIKTKYTKLLEEEKKVEAMIEHPKYLELKEHLERNTSRINVAMFHLLGHLPLYNKLK